MLSRCYCVIEGELGLASVGRASDPSRLYGHPIPAQSRFWPWHVRCSACRAGVRAGAGLCYLRAMHIVITGASSGIGRDLAKAFDGPGRSISLVARRKNLLEDLRKELRAETQAIEADLANPQDPIAWLR